MDAGEDFRRYVAARQRALLRTAWVLTGDWQAAEDLVQTSLVRVWPHWRRVGGGPGADAYVRRTMVNTSRSWRRRLWRREVPTEQLPEPAAPDDDVPLTRVLVEAVRALPPRQRAVVALRFLDDVSVADTATALGCTPGTVKSTTSKALATLRAHPSLREIELEEGP